MRAVIHACEYGLVGSHARTRPSGCNLVHDVSACRSVRFLRVFSFDVDVYRLLICAHAQIILNYDRISTREDLPADLEATAGAGDRRDSVEITSADAHHHLLVALQLHGPRLTGAAPGSLLPFARVVQTDNSRCYCPKQCVMTHSTRCLRSAHRHGAPLA